MKKSKRTTNEERYCPVCGYFCSLLPVHFYEFYKCRKCEHTFNGLDFSGCLEYRARYLSSVRKNGKHVVQNVLTNNYDKWIEPVVKRKTCICSPLLSKNTQVLDCSAENGAFIDSIRDKVKDTLGVSSDPLFRRYCSEERIVDTDIHSLSVKKFDLIVMVNFLEFEYSPYETMIDAIRLLKPTGAIATAVPVGNNPVTNYYARTHEFSITSFSLFVRKIQPDTRVWFENDYGFAVIKDIT